MLSMPLRSKTNIMVDRVPVACNFKLPWQGCFRWHTFPSLSSLECICCTSRWVQAHRVYWRILLATRNSFPEREYSSGQPVSLSRKDLILVEFNLASFSQDHQIAKLKTPPNFPTIQYLRYSLPLVAFAIDWFQHPFFEFQSSVVESGYSPLPACNRSVEHMNSLLPTWQHEYQTVEALSWYYCNNYLHWCFEYTCMGLFLHLLSLFAVVSADCWFQ